MSESPSVTASQVWIAYRDACFAQHGRIWTWASSQLFEFDPVAVVVQEIADFHVEVDRQAIVLHAFGRQHFIPLLQATEQALLDAQLLIKQRQINALQAFKRETDRRLDGSTDPEHIIH